MCILVYSVYVPTYLPTYIHSYLPTYLPTYLNTYIHYITLHCITLNYITLYYITLHYIHTCIIDVYLCFQTSWRGLLFAWPKLQRTCSRIQLSQDINAVNTCQYMPIHVNTLNVTSWTWTGSTRGASACFFGKAWVCASSRTCVPQAVLECLKLYLSATSRCWPKNQAQSKIQNCFCCSNWHSEAAVCWNSNRAKRPVQCTSDWCVCVWTIWKDVKLLTCLMMCFNGFPIWHCLFGFFIWFSNKSRGARPSVTTLPNEAMSLKGKQLGTPSCVPADRF